MQKKKKKKKPFSDGSSTVQIPPTYTGPEIKKIFIYFYLFKWPPAQHSSHLLADVPMELQLPL